MSDDRVLGVLSFWFKELTPRQWFAKSAKLDRQISARFYWWWQSAAQGELWTWRDSPSGRLAEILLLDQFSRNIHRDTPLAFQQDVAALVLAQEAVAQGIDRQLESRQRVFLYMPYMHSESLAVHDEAVRLFDQPGLKEQLRVERRHRKILEKFGRYPHRNAILDRESTREELAFLETPGSSF